MKSEIFIGDDFLLNGSTAQALYHDYAEKQPIFDYHCHIKEEVIDKDYGFKNITQLWLYKDHYKWTAMRSNGIDEKYITGSADDYDKFLNYAKTLQYSIGNPIHHWSHMELARYFGYRGHLTEKTASEVWDHCNARLKGGLTARQIITDSNVALICTTNDPLDDLQCHDSIRKSGFQARVIPAWRPDQVLNPDKEAFPSYIGSLSDVSGVRIETWSDLLQALENRMDFFHSRGCRLSDHALSFVVFEGASDRELNGIFAKVLSGETVTFLDLAKYRTALLLFLARYYRAHGWTMQLHFGVVRDVNSRLFETVGPDAGGDVIGGFRCVEPLVRFMDALHRDDDLPKTILYSIDPADNTALGTVIGVFQTAEWRGKIQHGAPWWFNDTKHGIEAHLTELAGLGVLGNFIGMLTDSSSLLSYCRHDYFRRVLCNLLGRWVDEGLYPDDKELLGTIVSDICYRNAVNYFEF